MKKQYIKIKGSVFERMFCIEFKWLMNCRIWLVMTRSSFHSKQRFMGSTGSIVSFGRISWILCFITLVASRFNSMKWNTVLAAAVRLQDKSASDLHQSKSYHFMATNGGDCWTGAACFRLRCPLFVRTSSVEAPLPASVLYSNPVSLCLSDSAMAALSSRPVQTERLKMWWKATRTVLQTSPPHPVHRPNEFVSLSLWMLVFAGSLKPLLFTVIPSKPTRSTIFCNFHSQCAVLKRKLCSMYVCCTDVSVYAEKLDHNQC